jgi:hypothetical protein
MPEGVIVGGWNFVVAAYVLVGAGLTLYAIYLLTRLRSTRRQLAREGKASAGTAGARAATGARTER